MGKKVLFSGYYGFDNSGDDAILQAILEEVRKKDPSLEINVLSYNPQRTKHIYKVEATQRFHFASVKKAIQECDLLISGGGSLLQDVTSSRSLYYYLGIIALAKFYKKKVYVYANGVGPISGKINKRIAGKILNKVDHITLRDLDSLEVVKSLGVTRPPMEVTSDPVYAMEGISQDRAYDLLKGEGIAPKPNYIGVCVRQWKKSPALAAKLAKILDKVYDELGTEILFIPLHYPEDVHFSELVQGRMARRNYSRVIRGNYSVKEVQGFVGICQMVIAMRLHSLIYGVTEKVPAVGIVYDPKVKAHLEQVGIEEYVEVEKMDEKKLLNDIIWVYRNKAILRNKLQYKHEEFLDLTRRNVDYVFELLDQ